MLHGPRPQLQYQEAIERICPDDGARAFEMIMATLARRPRARKRFFGPGDFPFP